MIPYLLVSALLFGAVESQTANVTEEELRRIEGNQTFSESTTNNSTMKTGNVTFSLHEDDKSHIEDELQNNQTSTVITEDDENFQDQDILLPAGHCHQGLLVQHINIICGAAFETEMLSISTEKWCVLKDIIRPYNDMTLCLEKLSKFFSCYYPNTNIQDFFLHIHSHYFHNCSRKEPLLVDAPHGLVIALTLVPVSLIPVLVYLVVWKSKGQA
ncbi:receptor activity-modifying protein 3-like [Chelmon rostratus]|uniref:receptor activity-modifying protein 3-like n=1 Tax=Chelmon rostratus TaxID=109905 RepID=UPI001BE5C9E4|nr:receptor activity-modifying protein 3-like [Chelmon rostratus]